MQANVEIYILAGFLGSGKSTLLKNLLIEEKEKNRKVAVLMNELGELSVDSRIIGTDVSIKELLNGCICCTLKDEVEIQLLMLYQQEQPDVIYIEATGVAHPIEILDACMSPVIAPYVHVKSIINVVDSKRWLNRNQLNNQLQKLIEEQVKYGDIILLNKSDCISAVERAYIQEEITKINTRAQQFFTTFADVPLSKLKISREDMGNSDNETVHVHHHLHIQSMTYQFHKMLSKERFETWLNSLPPTIYRVKGFVRFKENPLIHVVQYSYGVPYLFGQKNNFPENLVLIGSGLDKKQLMMELSEIETLSE
ncbi:cobalamin biosynthesis protein [Bacillus sp. 7586-K]|nr:cobalamin biosynthesis protein [Bacillus sp. 7586-K]